MYYHGSFKRKSLNLSLENYVEDHDFFIRHQLEYQIDPRFKFRFGLYFNEHFQVQRFLISSGFSIKEFNIHFFLTNRVFALKEREAATNLGTDNLTASQVGINPDAEIKKGKYIYSFGLSYAIGTSHTGLRRAMLNYDEGRLESLISNRFSINYIQTMQAYAKVEFQISLFDDVGILRLFNQISQVKSLIMTPILMKEVLIVLKV